MKLRLLAWGHRAADTASREALAAVPVEEILSRLRARGVEEAAAVSTCNRFELYVASSPERECPRELLLAALSEAAGADLACGLETREDAAAAAHLFSVASGTDSLVVGETEILGQVKSAYETARRAGMTGKRLNVLFQRALYVGKRVRSETGIANGASSVPSVAVQMAESIFGRLEGKAALIVGAGAMAELAVKHLAARGAKRLTVVNRTWERAYALAARFHGEAARWEDLPAALAEADVVVSSTGAPSAVITRAMIEDALRRRAGRMLFLIDIAMPRDVEESAHALDGVYLYRLEDLQSIVARNMSQRAEQIAAARAIIDAKAAEFDAWARSLASGRELSLKHSDRPRRPGRA